MGLTPIPARRRAARRGRTASARGRRRISGARRRDRKSARRRNDRRSGRNRSSCGTTRWRAHRSPRPIRQGNQRGGDGLVSCLELAPKSQTSARDGHSRSREQSAFRQVSLTFRARGALRRPLLGKSFFSIRRPVQQAGGQRPTARCALGRERVWKTPHPEAPRTRAGRAIARPSRTVQNKRRLEGLRPR